MGRGWSRREGERKGLRIREGTEEREGVGRDGKGRGKGRERKGGRVWKGVGRARFG